MPLLALPLKLRHLDRMPILDRGLQVPLINFALRCVFALALFAEETLVWAGTAPEFEEKDPDYEARHDGDLFYELISTSQTPGKGAKAENYTPAAANSTPPQPANKT